MMNIWEVHLEVHHQPETWAAPISLCSTYTATRLTLPPCSRDLYEACAGLSKPWVRGCLSCLPNKRLPHSPFHPAAHASEPSLPKSYPLRFQTQCKRNVLRKALSCCPWLKAAQSGPCVPLRTLQKGWCPQRCPSGTWAQRGPTWTKTDCSYFPGAKEAKMLTANWPLRSSPPPPPPPSLVELEGGPFSPLAERAMAGAGA